NTRTLTPTTAGASTSETPGNTPSTNGWRRNGESHASDSFTTRTSGTGTTGDRGDRIACEQRDTVVRQGGRRGGGLRPAAALRGFGEEGSSVWGRRHFRAPP